jgi:hypothetical protein
MKKVSDEIEFEDPEKLSAIYDYFSSHGFYCRAGPGIQCYFDNHKLIGYIERRPNQNTSIISLFRKSEKFEETKKGLITIIN